MAIEIGKKGKVECVWHVSPYDYSAEKASILEAKFASKYGIERRKVKVRPDFLSVDEKGNSIDVGSDIIQNIQDPAYQVKLFKDYIEVNGITDYDFDLIKTIDAEVNYGIDYQVYDKYRRYSIKWVRWDNFLSYGEGNFFDFTQLGHICLLSGEPANQSGKTTLAIDLIRFLLFGRTLKSQTLDKVFNRFLPEATVVNVEGCICIDGVDYVIKRVLSRPALARRTEKSKTTQKVEYYKIVGSSKEELEEYVEDQAEENVAKTNKVIKEAIGRESDFELIMSVTDATLDDLVNKKEAERGRLLSRWIGLLPIEEKDVLARELYNGKIKPSLAKNMYDSGNLLLEITSFEQQIGVFQAEVLKLEKENDGLGKEIALLEESNKKLNQARLGVDESLEKVDIVTLDRQLNDLIELGKKKVSERDTMSRELESIGDVSYSVEEFDKLSEQERAGSNVVTRIESEYRSAKKQKELAENSEICPFCHRKLDNVDNSKVIQQFKDEMERLVIEGKAKRAEHGLLKKRLEEMKVSRDKYTRRNALIGNISAIEVNISELRSKTKDLLRLKKDYEKNKEAIDKNNKLEIDLRLNEESIKAKRTAKEHNLGLATSFKGDIKNYQEQVENRKKLIQRIKEEEILDRNWQIYLKMIGKDGISKMVLRKTLPIINARLTQLLMDVCDFDVEVAMNQKGEVQFKLIKDGVISDLSSGSGFELTASALALRAVLADMSTIPRCSGIILDEIFGRVSHENYDNMKNLIEKISMSHDWVWLISHNDEIKDWCDMNIIVRKENNVSRVITTPNKSLTTKHDIKAS